MSGSVGLWKNTICLVDTLPSLEKRKENKKNNNTHTHKRKKERKMNKEKDISRGSVIDTLLG